jgi:hypothetical protein
VKSQLGKLRAKEPFELREVNILEEGDACAKFKEEIPVVFINGHKAFKCRLDEREILRRLEPLRAQGDQRENGS